MLFRLIVLCLLVSSGPVLSQTKVRADTALVNLLARKASRLMLFEADSGFYYANKLIAYADSVGSDLIKATGYEKMAWSYWVQGNYAEGLRYALEAVRILENHPPSSIHATALLAAGRNLFEQKTYQMALSYYKRAEQMALDLKLSKVLLEAYRDIGGINIYTDNYEQGIDYCEKGVALAREIGDRVSPAIFNSHLALLHFKKGDIERAIDYNWKAILEGRLNGNRRIVALCFERLANIDLEEGRFDEAIRKATESLEMSEEIGSSLLVMRACFALSRAYEGKKQFEQALKFHKLYSVINDSTYNAGKESIIASMEAVYNLERKQREIELLEKEKALSNQADIAQRHYFILSVVVIVLLVVLAIVQYNSYSIKTKHNGLLQTKNLEIEKQAAKLAEMNATKSKIFSIIGHDLRSSIANLRQLMSVIGSRMISLEELQSITPAIKQSVDSSYDVLDNLLHWGHSQMNGIKTNMQPVDLRQIVQEIAGHFSIAVEKKGLTLSCEADQGAIVLADASQLAVVVRNLTANAVKFTASGGCVTIKAEDHGDAIQVSVNDSGVGISADKLDLLFKPDSHFSEVGTSQERGSGLGLLLCKEFLENMGSILEVKSAKGEGSSFYFRLKKAHAPHGVS